MKLLNELQIVMRKELRCGKALSSLSRAATHNNVHAEEGKTQRKGFVPRYKFNAT